MHRGRQRLGRVGVSYQSVAPGKVVVVPGSTGYLEVAIHGGDAARRLRLKLGEKVTLSRSPRQALEI